MKMIATCAFACVLPMLAACTDADLIPEGTLAPHAGEAVRRNIAAQLVNPAAPTGNEAQTMNGERAAIAQDAYAKDAVKEPAQIMTSSGGAGGGSGGGGAGIGGGGAAVSK